MPADHDPPRRPSRPRAGRPRGAARTLVGVLLGTVVLGACDDPRLPLEYMRQAATPEGMTSRFAELEQPRPREPRTLTDDLPPPIRFDWDSIQVRDTLKALLTFNSTSYFIHRGEPMGFEYDLLNAFAEDADLELSTVVVRDRRELFRALNMGGGDVVAARLVSVPDYRDEVLLTDPLYTTRPVVVQRGEGEAPLPDEDAEPVTDTAATGPRHVEFEARLLRRPSELAGEEVFVPAGSDYYERIVEISDSLGQNIELVEVQDISEVEQLIAAVSRGDIRLTVSQENLAELSQARFTNIVATPVLGAEDDVVWATRRTAPELHRRLNEWLASPEGDELTAVLYTKYFVDRKSYADRTEDDYLASETGRISPYDSLLTHYADSIGWDWKLLAAQVAQESRFDPRARSWVGARGLLQLMPRTAREMGVRNPTDPADNVAGGVRYIRWLSGLWEDEVQDEAERLKFVLASYNAGRGHVLDAQRLAEKNGDDPQSWDDVAYWLLQKSKRSVYSDPVVRHGYVRGLEPVQYVSKILTRYDRYRNVEDPTAEDTSTR